MSILKANAPSDSIYASDIDSGNSSNGDFSNECVDYFNSLKTVSVNTTSDNPKIVKLWFYRSHQVSSIGFGCDDLTKSFSNIKIKALGSGEEVRYTKDLSSDSTKHNSYLINLTPLALNGLLIEFHTADEVGLSNLIIFKSHNTNARLQAVQDDGDVIDITATNDGNLKIADVTNGLAIAKGDVAGSSFIHKFGQAPDFATADNYVSVWDGADASSIAQYGYTYSTSAIIDSISSSVDTDTQDIEVQGLDTNYDFVTQTITLTGRTRKALTTNLIRVFRLKNVGSSDIAGNVFCYEDTPLNLGTPVITTKIRAMINNGNNQTLMAIFTIPAGKTGYMRDWYAATAGASKTSNYIVDLKARPFGQVFQLKHRTAISDSGSSFIKYDYTDPEVFTEKTDIQMLVKMTATGGSGGAVSAGFDIVLIDN